uniref:HAT C-terminal dimerisation domain-containing protein n=1 Tax=Ditylenchus dipsaci TaxID=166011 RepID=A0A915EFX2_9BILA
MTGGSNQKHCSNSATSSVKTHMPSTYAMLAMQDEDPLIFWKNNAKYFPRLALLSRLMLAVAASSASSERAFEELRCVLGNFTRNRWSRRKQRHSFILGPIGEYDERFTRDAQMWSDSEDELTTKWTFAAASLYALTVITSTGYDHLTRPQMLVEYSQFSMFLSDLVIRFYGKLLAVITWCASVLDAIKDYLIEADEDDIENRKLKEKKRRRRRHMDDEDGDEEERLQLPIVSYFALVVGYCAIGSLLFNAWEKGAVNKSYEHCQKLLDAISDYSDSDEEIGEEMQQVAVPDAEVVPANRPITPPPFFQVYVVLAERDGYVFPDDEKHLAGIRSFFFFCRLRNSGHKCIGSGLWRVGNLWCLFHLVQNLKKHLAFHHLKGRYETDADFAVKCRMITAMAFVRPDEIIPVFEELEEILLGEIDLDPILAWTRKPQRNHVATLFAHSIWNVYDRTLNGDHRTNNFAEAANHRIQTELDVSHPGLWTFIKCLQSVQQGRDRSTCNGWRERNRRASAKYKQADARSSELSRITKKENQRIFKRNCS